MPVNSLPGKRPDRTPVDTSLPPEIEVPSSMDVVRQLETSEHRAALRKLTDRQLVFAVEYVRNGGNGQDAALAAGYSHDGNPKRAKRASNTANVLLKNETIRKQIAILMGKAAHRAQVTVDDVLEGLLEIRDISLGRKDLPGGEPGQRIYDQAGANRASELIGRHLRMYVDRVEVTKSFDSDALEQRLNAALEAREKRMKIIDGEAQRIDKPLTSADADEAHQQVMPTDPDHVSNP